MTLTQTPPPDDFLLRWKGDTLTVTLRLDRPRAGHAAFRTNLGGAAIRRREIIAETERGEVPLARAWTDLPMDEVEPGVFRATFPLNEIGVFSGKACFFPAAGGIPEWPEGKNLHIKVMNGETRRDNAIYCVFPRQFGSFREVIRRLPTIMETMGFRIIQTLPPFPVPVTYAVMGEYGCPFAATDFLSVDPAMAEFDARATPLDQFRELIGAVHARGGRFFVDLPANHTGWASTLQTHHPEWFRRTADGCFASPGAWGVTWADLVELDYRHAGLRAYMADVFLFWCRNGVDGFRCDAGYMIPAETWDYIVARVREEYPDTIFFLEGLGGQLETTDRLLAESNLDWAYSEIFQTPDRAAFEWYLPSAIARAERYGALVHFAETHDNDRLAKQGETYARLRVQLAALLSWQGCWGIANGVEWLATEKIDVHGRNDLNWGAARNLVTLIARLNRILRTHPSFSGACHLALVTQGSGNVLAVLREQTTAPAVLVLANLDCTAASSVEWNRARFPQTKVRDLLTDRTLNAGETMILGPGEVRCLVAADAPTETAADAEDAARPLPDAPFHVRLPQDCTREIVVPAGETVEFRAANPFRVRLVDPTSGRTLRVFRSPRQGGLCRAQTVASDYAGDGTRNRVLELRVTRYADGRALATRGRFVIPPPADRARARLTVPAEDVRRNPDFRTILADGAGSAAQLRLGWGRLASQYDALLAANPNPQAPGDRLVLWTRTRIWLQREGYSREWDARCVTSVETDPAGTVARWNMNVPCGMGLETTFVLALRLEAPGRAILTVRRIAGPETTREADGRVRIVFRPDLEWRSFHETTKAFKGPEQLFPSACAPRGETGVDFAPYGDVFRLTIAGGAYHHEPLWTYNVAHPEEAARGQENAGDLFSPGWVSADLAVGEQVTLTGLFRPTTDTRTTADAAPDAPTTATSDSFGNTLRRALDLFIVRCGADRTILAGYPWFLDWGRDTFICLRGLIAAGEKELARAILSNFAAHAERGTLPNILANGQASNRDTTDAQLWFIRCVEELGEAADAPLVGVCQALVDDYLAGTPNGIRVDADSALVWSPSHFTWMDTNYPACTPRIGYPVEIQALWIAALRFLGRNELAARARTSVIRLMKNPAGGYCDCLAAPNGERAAEAVRDAAIRPNQLFLLTLGIVDDATILDATEPLLVPGGLRSLASDDPAYRGSYAGDEDTSRKPAYHNGTVWGWLFPQYAEALAATGRVSKDTARALLASAVDALNTGCIGHLPEIADGDSPHAQKGCAAQAWSVSELLRVWLKLAR